MPLFSLFQPLLSCLRCSDSPEPPRCFQALRNGSPQGRKDKGTRTRTREREEGKGGTRSPQANKERDPPLLQWAGSRSPHHKFAPKNQQKVAWVDWKKFSEKFFGGMFRGKKNPLRCLNGRGDDCLINLVMKIVK